MILNVKLICKCNGLLARMWRCSYQQHMNICRYLSLFARKTTLQRASKSPFYAKNTGVGNAWGVLEERERSTCWNWAWSPRQMSWMVIGLNMWYNMIKQMAQDKWRSVCQELPDTYKPLNQIIGSMSPFTNSEFLLLRFGVKPSHCIDGVESSASWH